MFESSSSSTSTISESMDELDDELDELDDELDKLDEELDELDEELDGLVGYGKSDPHASGIDCNSLSKGDSTRRRLSSGDASSLISSLRSSSSLGLFISIYLWICGNFVEFEIAK